MHISTNPFQYHIRHKFATLCILSLLTFSSLGQVQLRDTIIEWQHHSFTLNSDYSLNTYSTQDTDIDTVLFTQAKVLENDLIRLVLVPEYGGRVLSFYYKPTGHEYLYQSECGSAYNIGNGIFYYDWLMVYGGIFPTFPEPEHGKTWMKSWDYSVIKNTSDTVTVRMEYLDNTAYSRAPGSYNNGTTNIRCQVDISIYSNTSIWDFDVNLINQKGEKVGYEYWTCTTLTPGCEVGKTASPLNSEMVIPAEKYKAGWSPGSWIGGSNSVRDMSAINYLSEWNDMGIAYAEDFEEMYWGVINHDNQEGVFRVSENIETPGVKLWTWGKNNVDNNMFDFSNGGNDNYIELWAGVSDQFFTDAQLQTNEQKGWKESYCATTNMSAISNMNRAGAVNLLWDEDREEIAYELNTFVQDKNYTVEIHLQGNGENEEITSHTISFEELGQSDSFSIAHLNLMDGEYNIRFDLLNLSKNVELSTNKTITLKSTSSMAQADKGNAGYVLRPLGDRRVLALLETPENYTYHIFSLSGQEIESGEFSGSTHQVQLPNTGMYIISMIGNSGRYTERVFVR